MIQAGLSFLIWIGYGVLQVRRGRALLQTVKDLSRKQRLIGAPLLLIGGLCLLFLCLLLIDQLQGFVPGSMKPWAWIVITLVGLVFVHAQTYATAMLAVLARESAVTPSTSPSSTQEESQESL